MNKLPLSTKNFPTINFLLVGVGGQGTIMASNILAELGIRIGYDVKQAEVHGMSQRGGSVTSNLRWAKQVFSPVIPRGEADVLIGFEKLEAARFADYLRPGGIALINDHVIVPVTVTSSGGVYPTDSDLHRIIEAATPRSHWLDGIGLAEKAGDAKAANTVILGALSAVMDIPDEHWIEAIKARIPAKQLELNLSAFKTGKLAISVNT